MSETDPAAAEGDRPPGAADPIGGFLLLDKPAGISSFEALYPVKRAFRGQKVGHAGTLDPAASGLLLAGIGHGTRLLEYLEGMPKAYSFLVRLGLRSASYDMEGEVTGSAATGVERSALEAALPAFRGRIRQAPPAFSAVKVDGRRAYDLARAGEAVTLESREVEVFGLELLSFEAGVAAFRLDCSKGTYVRSIAHDLGERLGCGAVADGIRRLAIGPYKVEEALPVAKGEDGRTHLPTGPGTPALLPLDTAVAHLPTVKVPAKRVQALRDGRSTAPGEFAWVTEDPAAPGQDLRVLDPQGQLLAIATLNPEGHLCPKKVLSRN